MNGCNVSGSIKVVYLDKPIIQFPGDTTLCVSQHLTLDASNPGSEYLWQDGSESPQFW